MTVYVLMGVSGTGKSTVGRAAANALGLTFIDADDLHSPLAIAKMTSGVALKSEDRMPWGEAIIQALQSQRELNPGADILIACSALEMKFRKTLRAGMNGDMEFLHLHGDIAILKRRLAARKNHFFKSDMLAGQFAALDMPHRAAALDIALPLHRQVEIIAGVIAGAQR